MQKKIWNTAVYLFVAGLLSIVGIALLAIWGYVPKELLWKALASGGVFALFLLSLSAALRAMESGEARVHRTPVVEQKSTTLDI